MTAQLPSSRVATHCLPAVLRTPQHCYKLKTAQLPSSRVATSLPARCAAHPALSLLRLPLRIQWFRTLCYQDHGGSRECNQSRLLLTLCLQHCKWLPAKLCPAHPALSLLRLPLST
jgi:hypothetical protein